MTADIDERDALLSAAIRSIVADDSTYRRGTRFDRWAFSVLYAIWVEGVRLGREPVAAMQGDPRLFEKPIRDWLRDEARAAPIAKSIADMHPLQRAGALLLYAEQYSYEETAALFDIPVAQLCSRVAQALAGLANALAISGTRPITAKDGI